jgi:hypothetical protein
MPAGYCQNRSVSRSPGPRGPASRV